MASKRSLWKGPYVSWSLLRHWLRSQDLKVNTDENLKNKPVYFLLKKAKNENKFIQKEVKKSKKVFKIWSRSSTILPSFVGFTFQVHNGKNFTKVDVVKDMVGHKFGEFSATRKTGSKIKKKK